MGPPPPPEKSAREKQVARVSFALGLVASFAAWDEGYGRFAALMPFLAAGLGALIVRIYDGSERPPIDWKPGDPPPSTFS